MNETMHRSRMAQSGHSKRRRLGEVLAISIVGFCVFASAFGAQTGLAMAGGSYLFRTPASTSLGKCGTGMVLRERLLGGANVSGLWQSVAVACMSDATTADWVVLAGLDCGNENSIRDLIARCVTEARRDVPLLFSNRLAQRTSTNRMDYTFAKYAAGKDCQIVRSGPEFDDGQWACSKIYYFDGTVSARGEPVADPRMIHFRRFFSLSQTEFQPEDAYHDNIVPIPLSMDGTRDRETFVETEWMQ